MQHLKDLTIDEIILGAENNGHREWVIVYTWGFSPTEMVGYWSSWQAATDWAARNLADGKPAAHAVIPANGPGSLAMRGQGIVGRYQGGGVGFYGPFMSSTEMLVWSHQFENKFESAFVGPYRHYEA